jgi:hypothetical protein
MAPLSEQDMKKWRAVAGLNVILGSIVAIVQVLHHHISIMSFGLIMTEMNYVKQVATLISLYEWVDWIGIGIWGGCFMISAGTLTIRRKWVSIGKILISKK